MDPAFWKSRWEHGEIGFHRPAPHEVLRAHWSALALASGARVLVPLCGKSLDLAWLVAQGFAVTGVELSEIAITALFAQEGWEPVQRTDGEFVVWESPELTVYQGNMLRFQAAEPFDALYDRAATIALPPTLRAEYAQVLARNLRPNAPGLLIALERPIADHDGPPFHVDASALNAAFGASFAFERLHAKEASLLERPWRLTRLP